MTNLPRILNWNTKPSTMYVSHNPKRLKLVICLVDDFTTWFQLKCELMHVDSCRKDLGEQARENVTEECKFSVLISCNFKLSKHFTKLDKRKPDTWIYFKKI